MNGTKLEGIIGHYFGTTSVLVELEDLILQGEEKSDAISFEAVDFFRVIDKVKEELKAIEESSPSEAMKRLDYIEYKLGDLRFECERIKTHRCDDLFIQKHVFTTIKQALLKDQELEKENAELKKKIDSYERRIELYSSKQLEIALSYSRNENAEYRQLEDQISCPLEVLNKIKKSKEIYIDTYIVQRPSGANMSISKGMYNVREIDILNNQIQCIAQYSDCYMEFYVPTNEYKVDWFLKEDKSE